MPTAVAPEEVFRRYSGLVRRRARAILGSTAAADDAVQEIFLRVIRSKQLADPSASPITWLYRATTNWCLNQLRDERSRARLLELNEEEDEGEAPRGEAKVAVHRMLAALPEELREIGVYYFVDQATQEEIAVLMNVPRRTVGHRIEAFRAAARAALNGTTEVVS